MYHRAGQGRHSNSPEMLRQHLSYIKENYPVVLPGERAQRAVCLSFDDAFYDFYHWVFPLLKELKLRALLAVPTKYILDTTDCSPTNRLAVPIDQAIKTYQNKAPYCTWSELKEMSQSPYVQIASHSHSHCVMTDKGVDLDKEIIQSKYTLEENLAVTVNSFVYPYGRWNQSIQNTVLKHYDYGLRIGGASNFNWRPLVYRIDADHLSSPDAPFKQQWKYHWKYLVNRCRFK